MSCQEVKAMSRKNESQVKEMRTKVLEEKRRRK